MGVAALPVSIGVAILKYRLYEIDRIISRTAGLRDRHRPAGRGVRRTGPAGHPGVPVPQHGGGGRLHPGRGGPVQPAAHGGCSSAVDRRFNRARYDADQTVAAFAARLKDAVDLDSVRDDLAGVVHQALEPAHVSVWISQRG